MHLEHINAINHRSIKLPNKFFPPKSLTMCIAQFGNFSLENAHLSHNHLLNYDVPGPRRREGVDKGSGYRILIRKSVKPLFYNFSGDILSVAIFSRVYISLKIPRNPRSPF